jgi:hypothetical protein
MASTEPPAVEWSFSVRVAEGATIDKVRDAVAAHGVVLSVEFNLRGGSKSTAVALRDRVDVTEVYEFIEYEV